MTAKQIKEAEADEALDRMRKLFADDDDPQVYRGLNYLVQAERAAEIYAASWELSHSGPSNDDAR